MANTRKKTTTLPQLYFSVRGVCLYVSVRFNGVTSNSRSTGIKIGSGEKWERKTRTILNNDQSTAILQKRETDLTQIYYTIEGQNKTTNAHLLLDHLTGKTDHTEQIPTTLLGCFDKFIETERERLESEEIKPVTFNRHLVRRENMADFLEKKHKTKHLPLDQLNPIIGQQFSSFLKTQKRYGTETVNKDMAVFKRVLTFAHNNGWTNRNVLQGHKAESVKHKVKALSLSELRQIEALQNLDSTTEKVRWVFAFSCYTGLNHSDMRVLTPKDIQQQENGQWVLSQPRTKNGNERTILMPSEAVDIIKKYASHCEKTGLVLPAILEKDANKSLKFIQAQIQLEDFKLTTRVGRASFCSIMANLGVPLDMLRIATGHTNTQTLTKHYIKIKPETVVNAMSKAWEKSVNT